MLPLDGDPTARNETIGDDHFWAAPWLRRRRGWAKPHLEGSGGRGGDANRRRWRGGSFWPSPACWDGVVRRRRGLRLPWPRTATPARFNGRVWALIKGEKGWGECGDAKEESTGQEEGNGAVWRRGHDGPRRRQWLRHSTPSWRCTAN